jgi:DNA-binding LytR/AlgR family response regulator
MIIKCIAVDDEPLALNVLVDYINQMPFLELVEKFTNPFKALEYINDNTIDLLFIDTSVAFKLE